MMKPLTIKILTGAGLVGLYLLTRDSSAQAGDGPVPTPAPPMPVPPVPNIPRGIPDRENPDVFPVDQFSGRPVITPHRRRYGWPWF